MRLTDYLAALRKGYVGTETHRKKSCEAGSGAEHAGLRTARVSGNHRTAEEQQGINSYAQLSKMNKPPRPRLDPNFLLMVLAD